jgi:hypothetical protein
MQVVENLQYILGKIEDSDLPVFHGASCMTHTLE